jgi:hypothetical protein
MTCASMRAITQILMRRRDRFRRGLNTKLRERLNTVRGDSFNELVNLAISQEDCIVAHLAEKKRKAPMFGSSALPQRFRIVSNNQNRGFQQQAGRWVIRPPQQQQAPNRCNALNLGVEFFLLFSHQIWALLSFLFLFHSFFLISNQYSDRCPCHV